MWRLVVLSLGLLAVPAPALGQDQGDPAAAMAGLIKVFFSQETVPDWEGIERLPGIQWAQQVKMLDNCLPDGGCFTRQGTAVIGGRNIAVVASGARTMVMHVYLRNASAAIGGSAVLEALAGQNVSRDLARCPVRGTAGGTNWYRVSGANLRPGVLSIQSSCGGRPCEGFVLSEGEELPALQPNQVRMYSEQCGEGAERAPVSTAAPHEVLAQSIVALVPPAAGKPGFEWKALRDLPAGIQWSADGPKAANLSAWNDPNPMMLSGQATLAGRKFNVMASGTATEARTIYLEESGMHPRGEHVLGVVYEKGLAVQLVRCGPVYTESTNNWYRMTSARTRPVMIRQSIRYDGNQVQDVYELRLDGSLPKSDPRDRQPGVNGCR